MRTQPRSVPRSVCMGVGKRKKSIRDFIYIINIYKRVTGEKTPVGGGVFGNVKRGGEENREKFLQTHHAPFPDQLST